MFELLRAIQWFAVCASLVLAINEYCTYYGYDIV